jgi:hypothetical protein
MTRLLYELNNMHIPVLSLQVQQPSLDDFFLSLTGMALRDAVPSFGKTS